jgi:hypothetical protein
MKATFTYGLYQNRKGIVAVINIMNRKWPAQESCRGIFNPDVYKLSWSYGFKSFFSLKSYQIIVVIELYIFCYQQITNFFLHPQILFIDATGIK